MPMWPWDRTIVVQTDGEQVFLHPSEGAMCQSPDEPDYDLPYVAFTIFDKEMVVLGDLAGAQKRPVRVRVKMSLRGRPKHLTEVNLGNKWKPPYFLC